MIFCNRSSERTFPLRYSAGATVLKTRPKGASRARVVDKPPGILTPEQCVRLLEAGCFKILPAIALGFFAGLRPESEVWRLDWREVDLEAGLIRIEAAKTKSARHGLVEMSENLKLWLLPYRRSSEPSVTRW
jgi:integrase